MLERDVRRLRIDPLSPAIAYEAGFRGGECRADSDIPLSEEGHQLWRERIGVLDGRDAGAHGALDA